jgi:heterodisulfide reductase subunit A-like polyferredoxin
MKRGSGATASVWMGTADVPSRPALAKDITADVCIVGAGIAGLTTAYLLADEDRSVVVLDDGPIAGGETRGPAQVQPEKQRSITGCPLTGGRPAFCRVL